MLKHRVLYPGRFQPFHLGHLYVVRRLLEEFDEIVIAIGSAQEAFTCHNPFTAGERIEMIHRVLSREGISRDRYWLIPVPDIHKPLAWTSYLLGLIPRVEAVATGNPHVAGIYGWLGLRVIELELYKPRLYNGTRIRHLMTYSDEWMDYVPDAVVEYIMGINGVSRVKKVCYEVYRGDGRVC